MICQITDEERIIIIKKSRFSYLVRRFQSMLEMAFRPSLRHKTNENGMEDPQELLPEVTNVTPSAAQ